jgi:hypothetical protein
VLNFLQILELLKCLKGWQPVSKDSHHQSMASLHVHSDPITRWGIYFHSPRVDWPVTGSDWENVTKVSFWDRSPGLTRTGSFYFLPPGMLFLEIPLPCCLELNYISDYRIYKELLMGTVAHICNTSYVGGTRRKTMVQNWPEQKLQDYIWKII